jgi:23S rRNA (guanosine2251-2'-O)-methyltransferase
MKDNLIYGIHVVRHFLQTKPQEVLELSLSESREDKRIHEILVLAKQFGIALTRLDRKKLDQQFPDVAHQGVVAKIRLQPLFTENDLADLIEAQKNAKKIPLFLVLDSVQDPHNLGACLRTSDACGVTAVMMPKDRSAPLSAVVRKVACGGAETVPIVQVTNLVRSLEQLKELGLWIIGTSGAASQSLYQTDLKGPVALVLGAEGTGLRRLTEEHCDLLMHIPMHGVVESLNVSVATAVCLYEAVRQRMDKGHRS